MKHLGDITKISGYDAQVVDCIIGGSPCQDLSLAGKRAGLAGARSGLYMEQIRIIKEMRDHDRANGRTGVDVRPRYMVWENVPGAFSTNQGKDFAAVLEEAIKVVEPEAPPIPVPEKGWPTSGCIMGSNWSVAWRVLDAQFSGVPQRRRRIALVADFGGQSAPEILFVRKGVSGDLDEGRQTRKATALDAPDGAGADDRARSSNCIAFHLLQDPIPTPNTSPCLGQGNSYSGQASIGIAFCPVSIENHPADSRVDIDESGKVQTLTGRMGTGGGNVPMAMVPIGINGDIAGTLDSSYFKGCGMRQGVEREVVAQPITYQKVTGPLMANSHPGSYTGQDAYSDMLIAGPVTNEPIVIDRAFFNQGKNAQYDPQLYTDGTVPTLVAKGPSAVQVRYIVRRLTPLECERLQGYPDGWTDIGEWVDSKGKKHKEADSPRYKALGNSIAIPPWKWVLKRLCACYERDATMASLFDGIGGFPYIWEQLNGKGSCLWASEIEEFPIAVTKVRFAE